MHSNIYIEDEILPVWYDRLLIKHEFSTATEYATTSFTGPDTFTCNAVIQPGPSFYFSFVTRDAIQPIFRNWPLVKDDKKGWRTSTFTENSERFKIILQADKRYIYEDLKSPPPKLQNRSNRTLIVTLLVNIVFLGIISNEEDTSYGEYLKHWSAHNI